jgi:SAM-dependent methyltransferase
MRQAGQRPDAILDVAAEDRGGRHLPHDEAAFFESFYSASLRGDATDRDTIGPISEPEARFHYNAVENGIIRAMMRREPPPPYGPTVTAWRAMQQRRGLRLLDIGSGTGHWIDFFRSTFFVAEAVAIEIAPVMAAYLRRKYQPDPHVRVLTLDAAGQELRPDAIGGPVDYVSAIGVMFHIVDDERWKRTLANLAGCLKPGGLMVVGGDFGPVTRDAEIHKVDTFRSWREYSAAPTGGELKIGKRLRSLAAWCAAAAECELALADLVRSDCSAFITTPENDVLVLERRPA